MFRAMAIKELREIRGIVFLALVAYSLLLIGAITPTLALFDWFRSGDPIMPFIIDDFTGKFYLISVIFAIALGLRQTLGESIGGTYLFLLHRPASRNWLIGVKLLVGATAFLLCTAATILIYALWVATPGTHASPFEWSMTVPVWPGWLAMTILYLGAFHSVIRPACWYRSRLLPLAASALATFAVVTFAMDCETLIWPCLIVFVVDVWLITMILFTVQTRDYT
jgi:hypothetical protein